MKITDGYFAITGGASLVGSHIADALLEERAGRVRLIDSFALGTRDTVAHLSSHPNVDIVVADVRDESAMERALSGVDGVFHVAAFLTRPMLQNLDLGLDVNLFGVLHVIQACHGVGVRRLVFSSSVGVYGQIQGGIITEESPFISVGLDPGMQLYGISKLAGEALCKIGLEKFGLDFVCLRYSTVYGERQHSRGSNTTPIVEAHRSILRGERPRVSSLGKAGHDYVYVGDVARANVLAMKSDVSDERFNITSGSTASELQLVQQVIEVCSSTLTFRHDSEGAVRLLTMPETAKFSNEKARTILGWEPRVAINEGIRRLIRWREQVNRAEES